MVDTPILAELSTIHTNLSSNQCLVIRVELTIELLGTKQRKHTRDFDPGTDPIPKK